MLAEFALDEEIDLQWIEVKVCSEEPGTILASHSYKPGTIVVLLIKAKIHD